MLKELYTAALGMLPQQTRLEVIANNMANANTVGFKRQSVFERNMIDARANFYNVQGQAEQDDPPVGSYIDFESGSFQKTDNPLDVSIENQKGFFLVQDEDGNQFLTKAGHFTLSTDGTIITTDGKKLMGSSGEINVSSKLLDSSQSLDETASKVRITGEGEVFLNETPVGTISVLQVDDLFTIEQISNATFIARQDTNATVMDPSEVNIKQGWLENSNVDIIREMVSMIELQRAYEAGSKVIHTNDATLDNSMRLGRYY